MELDTAKLSTVMVGLFGIILLPLGGMWAINTIFQTGIEYSFVNWVACVFLQLYLQLILKAAFISTSNSRK
tara:strand:+ start:1051 stop:1263 length:213 start_codon:yes stop_codon:yes gene_type:complete